MKRNKRDRLIDMLEWLITPQDEEEAKLFKEQNLIDDYIAIKNRIPDMSEQELVAAIDHQLTPYKLKISSY